MALVKPEDWEWLGHPCHFIGADRCRFRLATKVGRYIVSTVGDYGYEGEQQEIGHGRTHETMVFEAGDRLHCGCYALKDAGCELDMEGYNTDAEAQAGHARMCRKWATARKQANP